MAAFQLSPTETQAKLLLQAPHEEQPEEQNRLRAGEGVSWPSGCPSRIEAWRIFFIRETASKVPLLMKKKNDFWEHLFRSTHFMSTVGVSFGKLANTNTAHRLQHLMMRATCKCMPFHKNVLVGKGATRLLTHYSINLFITPLYSRRLRFLMALVIFVLTVSVVMTVVNFAFCVYQLARVTYVRQIG